MEDVIDDSPGIKIIRKDDEGFDSDLAAEAADYTEKAIDDSRLVPELLNKLYSYRISDSDHTKL